MSKLVCASVLFAAATSASAQYVMVPDWTDRVMLFSAADGALVNLNFIPDGGATYNFESPREAIQVGNEIWVSDQISDSIFRFTASLTPQYISTISGQLDNLRGISLIRGTVYACNFGALGGAPGPALVRFDTQGNRIDPAFPVGDPHDVQEFDGNLIVTNGGADRIERLAFDGTMLTPLHDSDGNTGIDLPLQMQVETDGAVMVGGSISPHGIYRYNAAGQQVGFVDVGGVRGLFRLGNGNILFTRNDLTGNAPGVFVYDPISGGQTAIYSHPTDTAYDNIQWAGRLDLAPRCGSADFDGDGDVGTDADIEAFFACLGGNCCPTCGTADFDGDGDIGTDADIEAFFRVLGGGTC